MRITFILPSLNFSGGVMGVKRYCDELNRIGHDCQIYYPITQYRGISHPKTHLYFSKSQIPNADIVIATSWETAPFVFNLPDRCGKKFYYIQHWEQWKYHDTDDIMDLNPEIEKTYHLPLKQIFVSRFISRQINPKISELSTVVHAGTDIPEPFEKDYSEPRLLYAARPERWKGLETLIPALDQIKKDYPNVEIKHYGMPFVSEEEKIRLLKWANIFVFPSWIEGFGSPPLEAASYGCALVSTNTNAMPELLHPDYVIWIEPKNTEQIYYAIRSLLDNPNQIHDMGRCIQPFVKNYTWENAAKNFAEALKCGI